MSPPLVVTIPLWAGVVVAVVTTLLAAGAAGTLPRLHFMTVLTSFAVPLVTLAVCLDQGWNLTSAAVALIAFVVAGTGPVTGIAVARLLAQRQGLIPTEEPE